MATLIELRDDTPVMTPDQSMTAEDAMNSVRVSLADLCAKGTSHFAHKNYNEAADYFARASELQAELNGEMDPDNAEILFLYGRSLFKVGQSKSDVLGGKAGGEKKKPKETVRSKTKKEEKEESTTAGTSGELERITEEGVATVTDDNGADAKKEEDDAAGPKKPLFQFTGDENFEDSDDEEDGAVGEGDQEEEEDDLAVAFEVLDLARVLFTRKLEQPEEAGEKGKLMGDSPMTTHVKERLADTHDLLAEISLENERFPNAVSDFKSALAYKKELYPQESEIMAEAHYKLSLALEFASITTTKDDSGDGSTDGAKETHVDEVMREEAAKELEAAIESTKLKLQSKEVELASTFSPDDNDLTVSQISEVREIIADMEQRLLDLRAPPIDVNAAINGQAGAPDSVNPLGGILGATLGESPAEAQARIEEAKKTATDLTGLVRKKAKAKTPDLTEGSANGTTTNGKRKAEEVEEGDGEASKKVKVVDGAEVESPAA